LANSSTLLLNSPPELLNNSKELAKLSQMCKKDFPLMLKNRIESLIRSSFPTELKKIEFSNAVHSELGIPPKRFTQIRNNLVQPTFAELYRIAQFLKVSVDEIYVIEAKPAKKPTQSKIKSKLIK
jgi:transcriptional regulator with XRE-family HTH domain